MPTLTFRGGSPAYIDAQGHSHEARLGANGYIYKNAAGGWTPVGGGVSVVGPSGGTPAPIAPTGAQQAAAPGAAPPDPIYEAAMAGLGSTRDTTISGLQGARRETLGEYGFTEDVDPATGEPTGVTHFDPNNPFSRASLLKFNYEKQRRRTAGSLAAAGQQYSGAFGQARNIVNRAQLGAEDTLQKSLNKFLTRNTSGIAGARSDYETGAQTAGAERLARIPSNPLYEPTANAAPAAAAPTKATASVGRPQKTVGGQRFYQRASDSKWIPF